MLAIARNRKRQKAKTTTDNFDLMVDGRQHNVTATCYQTYNKETRYRVTVDDSPVVIFKWDDSRNKWIPEEDVSDLQIPNRVETAIAMELSHKMAA